MNRAIFLREFWVGLRQEVVAAGIVLGMLATGGWLAVTVFNQPIGEIRETLSRFLGISIAPLAFSSGARTFTAASRRRQELFLCVLPISRTSLWLSMVGGRLAAAFPFVALLFLVGFSLGGDSPGLPKVAVDVLTLYPALFASGCCFPLLFRRDATPYVVGFFIIFNIPPLISTLSTFLAFSDLLSSLLLIFTAGLFSVALLLLSWLFFQRGESHDRPRQLINLMLFGVTLGISLLVIGIVTLSPLLDGVAGPWTQDLEAKNSNLRSTISSPLVSSGGRYLAVVETLRARRGISRVTIVETATGRRIGMHRWRGLVQVSWNAQNEVLRILCRNCTIPFYRAVVINHGEWIWLTPEGRELAHHSLEPILGALPLRDGSDLLLDADASHARLIRWGSTRDFRVLADIPNVDSLYPWGRQGVLVTQFSSVTIHVVRQVRDGTVHAAVGLDRFLEPYLSFLREIEARSGQKLLKTSSKDRLLEKPIFGGVSLPDKLALYLPFGGTGALNLYDGSLDREIPLPACPDGSATTPELIPTRNSPAFLIRYQCRHVGALGQALQLRHFYYFPGSGSPKALLALDQVLDDKPILLAWLDERTAIWRPEMEETWKILRDGRVRTLWPPQPSE